MKLKSEIKEQQIFEATLVLIEQSGLAGLSMEAVAKKAKVATGTVYIYFKSKEELLNQLYINTKQKFTEDLFKGYSKDAPVKLTFQTVCFSYLDYFFKNHAEVVFMHQFFGSPYVSEPAKEITRRYVEPLYELLERGKREMLLKNLDTQFMVTFLHGTISELSGFLKTQPASSKKTYYSNVASLCWDALKA